MQSELKKQRQEYFLPNRVEAYQRAVLLMERIHPNSLIMRTINPALPSAVYQTELLKTIREEYDHNVAQQLFVSPAMWEMVKNSKEETIKIRKQDYNKRHLPSGCNRQSHLHQTHHQANRDVRIRLDIRSLQKVRQADLKWLRYQIPSHLV